MKKLMLLLLLLPLIVYAIPKTLDQQGILRNASDGSLISGNLAFNVSIFNATDDKQIYSEVKTITITDGVWNYIIGKNITIEPLIFRSQLYTRTKINNDLLPAINFSRVPYAFQCDLSNNTDYLRGIIGESYTLDTELDNTTIIRVFNTTWRDLNHTTDTNAGTACTVGEYLDGNGLCKSLNDSIDGKIAEIDVIFSPTSIATETGTLDSGDINSVNTLGDGDFYNVSEVSGAPGFMINVNFTNITTFNVLGIRTQYMGGSGHTIDLELFRLSTSSWEDFGDLTDQPSFGVTTFRIFNATDFVDSSNNGTVMFRFNHDDNGIASHDISIDFIAIAQTTGISFGGQHDATLNRDRKENHPWAFPTDASRAVTGQLNGTSALFTGDFTVNDKFNITAADGNFESGNATIAGLRIAKINSTHHKIWVQ